MTTNLSERLIAARGLTLPVLLWCSFLKREVLDLKRRVGKLRLPDDEVAQGLVVVEVEAHEELGLGHPELPSELVHTHLLY